MAKIFNPPPNWPAPPSGWQPPPGWQPEAAWGPAPPQWPLWISANPRGIRYSAAVGGILFLGFLSLLLLSGAGTAEGTGRLAANVFLPAVIVGYVAQESRRRWAWWTYLLAVPGAVVVATVVAGIPSLLA